MSENEQDRRAREWCEAQPPMKCLRTADDVSAIDGPCVAGRCHYPYCVHAPTTDGAVLK